MESKKMNKKAISSIFIYVAIFIVIALILIGYAWYNNSTKKKTTKTNPPVITTQKYPQYPNQNLTPGFILTYDTSFLCMTPEVPKAMGGNMTVDTMKKVFARYKLSYPPHDAYEIDRFIPLELGGSNDIRNLWPQPGNPIPGSNEKDKVELFLYNEVCNKTINLTTAQDMIKKDWVAVYNSCCSK